MTLTQGGRQLDERSGALSGGAASALAGGLRLFSGVCSHGQGTLSALVKTQSR